MIKKILKFLFIFLVTFIFTTSFLLFKDKFFQTNQKTEEIDLPPELYQDSLSAKSPQENTQATPSLPQNSFPSVPSQTSTTSPSENKPPQIESSQSTFPKVDTLLIPKLNVEAPIIIPSFPQKEEFLLALQKGVALHPSFAKPGESGMALIYGHSSRPRRFSGKYNLIFATLNRLKTGDEIVIYFASQKFVYKVEKVTIFYPNEEDKHLPKETQEKVLVLLTCWPPGSDAKRLAVVAKISS